MQISGAIINSFLLPPSPFQIESIYKKAHSAIRSDPAAKKGAAKKVTKKRWTTKKLTLEQRKKKIADRKAAYIAKLKAEA